MDKLNIMSFAIFGNPVKHSKSPRIHQLFSIQTGITHNYKKICVPINSFQKALSSFFMSNGIGANITLPFKQMAYTLCLKHTKRAEIAGAVNTLKKCKKNGAFLGDNTDGIGLLTDLQRQQFIKTGDRILIIGAGGAARGIILSLLSKKTTINITNRTYSKALSLAHLFQNYGDVYLLTRDELISSEFDLIINATSSGIIGLVPDLPNEIISENTRCYDLFYQRGDTPFIAWCRKQGALLVSDGLGMLVAQAAHSFMLWHGCMPDITNVINSLQVEMEIE